MLYTSENQNRFLRWCNLRGKVTLNQEWMVKEVLSGKGYIDNDPIQINMNILREKYHHLYVEERQKQRLQTKCINKI